MKRIVALVMLVCISAGSTSCATASGKGATAGGIIGGILGAGLAVATGQNPDNVLKYAAIGAAAGAATGYFIGRAKDKKTADRRTAMARYGYSNDQGFVVRIEDAASASQLERGREGSVSCDYLVISPDPTESIDMTVTFSLSSGGTNLFEQPYRTTVPNGGGVMQTEMTVGLPGEAPAGTYNLHIEVRDGSNRAVQSRDVQLYVG